MLWPYSSYTFMLLPIFFIYLFLCQSIKESPVSSPMGRDWKHFSVRVHRVRLGKFQAQRSTSHPHQEVPILEPTSEIPWVCFSLGGAARKTSKRNLSSVTVLSGAGSDTHSKVFCAFIYSPITEALF